MPEQRFAFLHITGFLRYRPGQGLYIGFRCQARHRFSSLERGFDQLVLAYPAFDKDGSSEGGSSFF